MVENIEQNWLTVQFDLAGTDLAQAEAVLEAQGVLSISLEDAQNQPLLEPLPGEMPIWQRVKISALFSLDTDPAQIRCALREVIDNELLGWSHKSLADQAWERVWMDDFKPMCFGERLWIVPSWSQPPEPGKVNLLLDPGLAFGTGTHPTTRLCLEWLDSHPPEGLNVIDYGCGSGILAIAALKLGAETVLGVDIDPQALVASRDNAQRNGLSTDQFVVSKPQSLAPTDLLIANILSGPLVQLATEFAQYTKPGGTLLLSGILDDQVEEVLIAYQPFFDQLTVNYQEGWCCIEGNRSGQIPNFEESRYVR